MYICEIVSEGEGAHPRPSGGRDEKVQWGVRIDLNLKPLVFYLQLELGCTVWKMGHPPNETLPKSGYPICGLLLTGMFPELVSDQVPGSLYTGDHLTVLIKNILCNIK